MEFKESTGIERGKMTPGINRNIMEFKEIKFSGTTKFSFSELIET